MLVRLLEAVCKSVLGWHKGAQAQRPSCTMTFEGLILLGYGVVKVINPSLQIVDVRENKIGW